MNNQNVCFDIAIEDESLKKIELLANIIVESIRGPKHHINIPIKGVIDGIKRSIFADSRLDISKAEEEGFVINESLSLQVVLNLVERNDYIMNNDICGVNINDLIGQILTPHGLTEQSILDENSVAFLCAATKSILLDQPNILHLKGPIILIGDLHGKYFDLLRIFEKYGFPDRVNYLLLGDYIDRGPDGLDIVYLLFALKVRFPNNIFLLRGNHECGNVTSMMGFKTECLQKYANYHEIIGVFDSLPLSAIISNKIFVVHGGISPHLTSLELIKSVQRPVELMPDDLVNDILWSDPNTSYNSYGISDRGPFSMYGKKMVEQFFKKFGFEMIIRAHEVVQNGFDFPFGVNTQVITLFSATDSYNGNIGGVMFISQNLHYSFESFNGLTPSQEVEYSKRDLRKCISL